MKVAKNELVDEKQEQTHRAKSQYDDRSLSHTQFIEVVRTLDDSWNGS